VPFQKFRSIEEMARAPVLVRAEDGFERFLRHCTRMLQLAPRRYPRGVFRFRTIEEAQDGFLAPMRPAPSGNRRQGPQRSTGGATGFRFGQHEDDRSA
jgi:hypothetical protein